MRRHYFTKDQEYALNISYDILKSDNLIFEMFEGDVTIKNIRSYNEYQMADPDYSKSYDMLSDLRDSEIKISFADIPLYVEFFNSIPDGENRKLAVVLNPASYLFLSTILLVNRSKIDTGLRLFKSIQSALVWLDKTNLARPIQAIMDNAADEHKMVS